MRLPLLNRQEELSRITRLVQRREGSLGVLYGRRRCGKSRLLEEVLDARCTVYYLGDDRVSALQRASLATEIARLVAGFDQVTYPTWDALLTRWWSEARPGMVLVLDEFPALVSKARELPSLLQKYVDRFPSRGVHLILAGSSLRMMQGLVLDRSAPLYGRAVEILPIGPLAPGWIQRALGLRDAIRAVENYAVWGGIPRYWELATDHDDLEHAVQALVLSPLGILHDEPNRLLLDDLRETTQAASILSLIGRGCHRISEIGGRLGKPATSLSRPTQRLLELGLVRRELPFGSPQPAGKRTLYRIADPFLRYWFRFVEPNRSRLQAGSSVSVATAIRRSFPSHVGSIWEELARASVPRFEASGHNWEPASRWWGPGLDRRPTEIDIVAESEGGECLLLGEVGWSDDPDVARLVRDLRRKATDLPITRGREVRLALWLKRRVRAPRDVKIFTPRDVLQVLR